MTYWPLTCPSWKNSSILPEIISLSTESVMSHWAHCSVPFTMDFMLYYICVRANYFRSKKASCVREFNLEESRGAVNWNFGFRPNFIRNLVLKSLIGSSFFYSSTRKSYFNFFCPIYVVDGSLMEIQFFVIDQ